MKSRLSNKARPLVIFLSMNLKKNDIHLKKKNNGFIDNNLILTSVDIFFFVINKHFRSGVVIFVFECHVERNLHV